MDINTLHQLFLDSSGVSTDTRTLQSGQLYFALKGENFDGNQYAAQALEKGAKYVVIDDKSLPHASDDRYLLFDDALTCLQDLATTHRLFCKATVIAITGSNGKTTTKELLTSVLGSKYQITATKGNLNNHIGVPLTLLSVEEDTEYSIVEMGANNPYDIEELCQIAMPDYGYITNIGSAHLEGFGDLNGVYLAKTALFRYLQKTGVKCFVNQFDEYLVDFPALDSEVEYLDDGLMINMTDRKQLSVKLGDSIIETQLTGGYNLDNINAAITLGKFFNVPFEKIVSAIENYEPTNKRSQIIEKDDHTLILDAYNANPSSMKVALKNAIDVTPSSHQTIAVIGDMYELGKDAIMMHQEIIKYAIDLSYSKLVLIGKLMSEANRQLYGENYIEIRSYNTVEEFKPVFELMDKTKTVIVIKASRGVKLETLVN